MLRLLTAALAVMLAGAAAAAQVPIAGDWRGEWMKGGDPLPVSLSIRGAGSDYSGSFSSDALQVADIPLSRIFEAEAACIS